MDIRLPDGTILRGVPDGTTKEQIREKLAAKGYDVTKLDAPKPPQQDPMVPADQRQSGYRATLGLPEKGPTAAGVADAVTRGVAPYAIAAGAGAGAGSVVPGVGTLTGAGAGVTALALTDAASGIWNNTAVPFLGAPQMTGGSDAIRNMTDATGVTKPLADDPNARVAYQMANMGASSMGFGNVVNMGGQLLSRAPGPIGAIGNFFAKPITATSATAGGVGGGAASQVAAEMGAPPLVQMGAGMIGSMAAGQFGAGGPKPATPAPSGAALKARENAAYDAAHAQGVEWTPAATDDIISRAVQQAVGGTNNTRSMPTAAVSGPVRDVLRRMSAEAAANGRLDSKNLDFFRRELGQAAATLGGAEQAVALRIREALDTFTAQPENTLNALRSNVASARTAAQQAEAAATAARGTPGEAAARQAADAARVRYEQRQAAMHSQDPDMAPAVQARDQAAARAQTAETRAMDTDAAYNRMAAEQVDLEEAAIAAEAAYEAAVTKYANTPNAPPLNKARAAFRKATDVANANAPNVDRARAAADRAQSVLDRTQRARDAADRTVQDREGALASVDDAAARVGARNSALAEGRSTVPNRVRTEAFEEMPEAARTASGNSGDRARALRDQVRSFIRSNGGREFDQLPEETQRQLQRFVNGGGVTQRITDTFGRLAPGTNERNTAGNIIWGLGGAAGFASGGMAGLAIPAGQLAVGMSTRGIGNAMASAQMARLRDMVARGDAVLPRQPGQAGNRAVNYMLNAATQPDIRQ
jgi:hypothetical protein